ncbi:MAG TPA: hypothetical protein VFQ53_12820 [Kofleriaceae bacterium]|nr:hypothetical protein [Kofleriaceae bacterium]
MEIVKLLREVARRDILFGVIRWCDDWLGARRTLVARVEAQLPWFAEHAGVAIGIDPAPGSIAPSTEPTETPSTPRDSDEWHTDRTTGDRHDLGFETDVGIDRL